MAPKVSVIVTCFNQANYLERAVKSVLSQTFFDLECIIIDDGSIDNTKQIAEQLLSIDSRVSYFHKENGGVSSARNFGFQQAQGEWIEFLDGDDWIDEDKIRFQLTYLNNLDGENTVFYSDYERVFIDKTQNIADRQKNIIGSLTTEQLIERLLMPDFLANSPFPLLQQCLLMHRSIFHKKMFDESLKALQDRDFTLDLLLAGVKFVYTPIVGAFYTKHQSNRTNNWQYMLNYYLLFYETVHKKHKELTQVCKVGVNYLIEIAIQEKDGKMLSRLINIACPPFNLLDNKLKINNTYLLRAFYAARLVIPNFVLYKQYRGPRYHKVISMLSKLTNFAKA